MNSLLIFLVRHDNAAQLAAHLVAGIAALLLLIGTSRSDAPASPASEPVAVHAPVQPGRANDVKRVELPIAAVASATAIRR